MQLILIDKELQSINIGDNRDFALINVIKDIISTSNVFDCILLIQKNVLTNHKKYFLFKKDDGWTTFLIEWTIVINSSIDEVFDK